MGLNKPLNLQYIKCLFLAGKLGGVGLTGHDWTQRCDVFLSGIQLKLDQNPGYEYCICI